MVKYTKPEMEVLAVETADVVLASVVEPEGPGELPFDPAE